MKKAKGKHIFRISSTSDLATRGGAEGAHAVLIEESL